MRITYVFDRLLPDHPTDTQQALSTVSALGKAGARVTLVVPKARSSEALSAAMLADYYEVAPTFDVVEVPSLATQVMPVRKLLHPLRARKLEALRDADIVYTRNSMAMWYLTECGFPVVYDTHRIWPDRLPLYRPVFRSAMTRNNFVGAILHSKFAMGSYERLGVARDKLRVIYNGYNPAHFAQPLAKAEAREVLSLPMERPIVVYMGHINTTKGIGVVTQMAARSPETLFVLVGSRREGLAERRIGRLQNVRIEPWQPASDAVRYLYAADVLLLPPTATPLKVYGHTVLPIKVYQYLAAGRAILGPDIPDLREILSHGENAHLVAPDTVDAAVHALGELVSNTLYARKLGQRALKTAAELTWDARAQKIITFLDEKLRGYAPHQVAVPGHALAGHSLPEHSAIIPLGGAAEHSLSGSVRNV